MRWFASLLTAITALAATAVAFASEPDTARRVNVLLVTVDDMNWNSVGAFGNPLAGITPNIDRLAEQGRRYERAYVTASNCSPSRVALQTGLYPQQSGATGFFYIDDRDTPTIATMLRQHGFMTGAINKVGDSNPGPDGARYWDYRINFNASEKFSARRIGDASAEFFSAAKDTSRPFYLVVNIADPHKPNFNDPEAASTGADVFVPSRIIAESEVTIPPFLPDLPGIRRDVRNYYNSVKRADDTFGAVMRALRVSGLEDETLVIFLSDHGMPFPFAKSSVYENSLRTPLVMKWSGRIAPGSVETQFVSAVDLMPTILDAAGVAMPVGSVAYLGKSLLSKEPMPARPQYAFGNFDENAKGYPVPMRGVIAQDWGYVFNAWSDGEHEIRNDDMNHRSFKEMVRHAPRVPAIKDRLDYYLAPPVEELCHLKVDPHCIVNLAGDPAHTAVLAEMRSAMRAQMVRTDDYLLEAFDARADKAKLRAFMRRQREAALDRASRLQWKRDVNIAGGTRRNRELFRRYPCRSGVVEAERGDPCGNLSSQP